MPKSAQGRVLKVIWSLWAESPKRVSRTVQTLFRTGQNTPKHSFAPCKRLFWDSHSGGLKTPFALSLGTFGRFGCFDTCTRPAGSQNKNMTSSSKPMNLRHPCASLPSPAWPRPILTCPRLVTRPSPTLDSSRHISNVMPTSPL